MTNHDELLNRLNQWKIRRTFSVNDVGQMVRDCQDSATAIRYLEQQLADEKKAREEADASANKWYVQAMTQSSTAESALAQANARLAEVEGEISECVKIPTMPFPDPGAHSWEAFGRAAHAAWCRVNQKLRALNQTAAAQIEGKTEPGLPDAGGNERADAALSSVQPAASAAPPSDAEGLDTPHFLRKQAT